MKRIASNFLLGLALLILLQISSAETKMAVYYETTLSAKEREKVLKSGVQTDDLMVFARSKDFFQLLEQGNPPVVIAPSLFETSQNDYEPVLQFTVSGKKEFSYKIIALEDKKVDLAKEGQVTFGMVEETDRQKIKKFFKESVGISISKINTVSKPEDLFPLLIFNSADVIIVSEESHSRLKQVFSAKTKEINGNVRPVLYPRVYMKKGGNADLIKKIESLSQEALTSLGFSGIERIQK